MPTSRLLLRVIPLGLTAPNVGCVSTWIAQSLTHPPNGGQAAPAPSAPAQPANPRFFPARTVHAPPPRPSP